jgi:beta-fructofuranosidase
MLMPVSAKLHWECPSLFRLGDRWALIYSPHAPVKYYTGQMDFAHCRFAPQVKGQFDFGRFIGFYAATVMPAPPDRTILWAWMHSNNKGRGWNGCLLLPRTLRLLPDGRIGQDPVRELETLRGVPLFDSGSRLASGVRRYAAPPGGCAEILMTFKPLSAGRCGVRLFAANGSLAAEVECSARGVAVAGDTAPLEALGGAPPTELRIYLDRSLLEIYVNRRVTVSRWLDAERIAALEFFAESEPWDLSRLALWPLAETADLSAALRG